MIFASEKVSTRHGTVDLNQPISVYEYSTTLEWTLKQDIDAVGIIQLEAFLIDGKFQKWAFITLKRYIIDCSISEIKPIQP